MIIINVAAWKTVRRDWELELGKANEQEREAEPKLKGFDPKNGNLDVLNEYTEDLGDEYWSTWVKEPYGAGAAKSWILSEKLKEEAERLGMKEKLKLDDIIKTIEKGATLGIEGEGRWPSNGPNNNSALEFGQRLADSLQSAIKAEIMWGPLSKEEMPWTDFKVSPMTVCLKPNGAAMIIMNLSWPHEGVLGDGKAISVNAGMSEWESFEDTKMTSDTR